MRKAFIYSFKHSIPILVSFIPVGLVYGVLMSVNGYNALWSALCSLFVFAGSLQYLMIDFFTGTASYLSVAIMAALLNSRHIFYGLPFIEKWKDYGAEKLFLIFALPDEAFSLHVSSEIDDETNEKAVYIFNALFVLVYWVSISFIGGFIGNFFTFNTSGMDFALTALFIVIVLGQIKTSPSVAPGIIAIVSSLVCLAVIGPSYFILPSLIITLITLVILRPKIEDKFYD